MSDENYVTPAILVVNDWLRERDMSVRRLALEAGLDPSEFARLLRRTGAVRVTAETAVKVERATKGAVTVEMWVPVRKEPA